MPLPIEKVPLFKSLSRSDLDAIRPCLKEKAYEKGENLFSEGQCCERVFIVQSGRIKLYRTASSGREQILEMLNPGDTCACNPGSSQWQCLSSAEAVVPSKVWFLSRNDYVRIVQTSEKISHSLNQLFAERLQVFSSLIEEVSLKDVKKRLIKFLLDMGRENAGKEKKTLYIPFTREEIAQRIGTARETVTRHLQDLKRRGLIEIRPYQIVLSDPSGLQRLIG